MTMLIWVNLSKWNPWVWPDSRGWFRAILPYQKRFFTASLRHDLLYTKWWTDYDKGNIDLLFYNYMLADCDTIMQELFAWIYYQAVKVFWFLYFNYTHYE